MEKVFHILSLNRLKKLYKTSLEGLSQKEAEKRILEYGLNQLKEGKKTSPLTVFVAQFKDFLILILLGAVLISLFLGETLDGLIILSIVVLSAVLGFIQEYRSSKALEALKKMAAPEAQVLRDGVVRKILASEVVPGDILVLSLGDKVAADARLIEEIGLEINEAVLTGESFGVKKEVMVLKDEGLGLGDRKNMIFSGTIVSRGHGRALVVGTGMETEFGKIAKLISEVKDEKTPLEKRLEKVGRVLGIGSILVCALASLLGILRGYPVLEMFLWGVSLAVAAVPEALPAVVTGSLSLGVLSMARKKAIVKRLPAVETLGSISVICSDKTGTLTKNEMTIKNVFVNGKQVLVEGAGYEPSGSFLLKKGEFDFAKDEEFKLICQLGTMCNDASLEKKGKDWLITGDPTEAAFLVLAQKAEFKKKTLEIEFPRVGEIAFDMERKRMSTIHEIKNNKLSRDKYLVAVKGAPESVLGEAKYIKENGEIKILTQEKKALLLRQTNLMAKKALRVLGVAYREVKKGELSKDLENLSIKGVEKELVFLGLVGMMDPPREEAQAAIKSCFKAGITPIIITGDHMLTTLSIGKKIGLFKEKDKVEDVLIEGRDLDKMSDEKLLKIINKRSFSRVSPSHKLRIVKLLQQKGFLVAMTGDGINDAPALKKADIGVAMGITGTDVTKEAADMILADDNFATIVEAIRKGREIYDNIKKYLFYLLRCNVGEILVLGGGFLLGFPPVLSAVQILWINLATDGLPALALGMDPPDPEVMKRKPQDPKVSIFSKKAVYLMFILAFNMALVLLPQFNFFLKRHNLVRTQTIVFITMVLMEMLNAYNSRSDGSLLRIKVFNNKWLNLAVLLSLGSTVLIVQNPLLSKLFKTVGLSLNEWLLALLLSLSAIVVGEMGKLSLKDKVA
ncbi:ATPase [Candidatus Beckwithbacteria bacterium CG10_big_fil_rev_8_21_14_0_10_34_10]|uniref:ATPase n=1 Tax=Candidatus Beckwithbacteria bacterium CG10_big_fil_rev_8_21_14_0_10_34_10 TaxID=1974495 RepID=A0A2H0W9V4_9BACT|nr:MAG: ATPase [Candidatus Beckwithbacteria bacterium CG10_big_fil_rev_8_21_14_0_10_34_10]